MSYGAPPPPPGAYGGQPAAAGNNKKAVWSLVTGILGLCCCQLAGVAAIFLSRAAKDEIRRTGQGGDGFATAGFILGIISMVLLVINIILVATGNFYYEFDTN